MSANPQPIARPAGEVPFAFAKRHGVVVREVRQGTAICALRSDASAVAVAELRRVVRLPLQLERVSDEEFDRLLRLAYEGGGTPLQMVGGLEEGADLAHLAQDLPEQADLLESDDDAPIIRLINAVLGQAIRENASDIHIEPFENRLVMRFRVDGELRDGVRSLFGQTVDLALVEHRDLVLEMPRDHPLHVDLVRSLTEPVALDSPEAEQMRQSWKMIHDRKRGRVGDGDDINDQIEQLLDRFDNGEGFGRITVAGAEGITPGAQGLSGEPLTSFPFLASRFDHLRLTEYRDTSSPQREEPAEAGRLASLGFSSVLLVVLYMQKRPAGVLGVARTTVGLTAPALADRARLPQPASLSIAPGPSHAHHD